MQLKKKLGAGLIVGALLGSIFAPAAFAQTAEISGNGDQSTNTIGINITNNCLLKQTNNTYVSATVISSANTGGNQANRNTGADVTIDTGDASSTSSLTVNGGSNEAMGTDACCCPNHEASPAAALISGNGLSSNNTVGLNKTADNKKKQKTKTSVSATVKSKAKTGKNRANSNTGNPNGGVVEVLTGGSVSEATVEVTGGSNTLNP